MGLNFEQVNMKKVVENATKFINNRQILLPLKPTCGHDVIENRSAA